MTKGTLVLLAVAAAATGVASSSLPIKCNPSSCPSTSQECAPCNARLDNSCVAPFPDDGDSGTCTELVPLDFTGVTYGVPLYKRCRQIVDPGWTEVKPEPMNFGDYVSRCREGFLTCNDGSCESLESQTDVDGNELTIPSDCIEDGVAQINPALAPDAKCNIKDDDMLALWTAIAAKIDYSKYCTSAQAGGIRYSPFRCTRPYAGRISDECPEGSRETGKQCEVNDEAIIAELNISDGCHVECDADKTTKDLPGCCLDPEGEAVCSHIEILDPTDSVERCTEAQLVDDKCSVCETNDASTNTHPFCCMEGVGPGESPKCVNSDGREKLTNEPACRSGGSLDLTSDVCYVESEGSDANPPAVSDTDVEAVGVDVTFKFDGRSPTNLDSPCCCDVVCSCFGDPHCTSFAGNYEISQQSSGSYVMLDDPTPKLKVEAQLGRPLGVNKKVTVTIDDDEYLFNAFDCIYDKNYTLNGEEYPLSDLPELFTYTRQGDRPTEAEHEAKRIGRIQSLNAYMVNNPPFITFTHGLYKVQLKCVRFRMTQGYFAGSWWSRIDTKITRQTTQGNAAGCCPTLDETIAQLQSDDATGFCYTTPFEPEPFLPGITNVLDTRRRLSADATPDAVGRVHRALTEGTREALPDPKLEALVKKYAKVQKMSLVESEVALHEQGRRALEDSVRILEDSCYTFASDAVFDLASKTECSEGLTLEAAKVGTENWVPIKFFPRDVQYCDDSIKVVYAHTMVSPGVYLDNTYKLRLVHCSPDISECPQFDVCEPVPGVSDIGVMSYMYGSKITDLYEQRVEYAVENCGCAEGDADLCLTQCIGYGQCPEACAP